ncbi:MAG: hypothetical protein NT099_07370 [Candidatus Saganbacteria bacterium]|nr:hypothetical protein [Candidatus Saganbacteria bacterium]
MGTIKGLPALLKTAQPTALIITHMQNGYAPWSSAAIKGCRLLAEHAKDNRMRNPNKTGTVFTIEVYAEDECDFDECLNIPLLDILGYHNFTSIPQGPESGRTQEIPRNFPYERVILTGGALKYPGGTGECQFWTFKALLANLSKTRDLRPGKTPIELHFVADSLYMGDKIGTAPFRPESLDLYLAEVTANGFTHDYYFNGQLQKHEENPALAIFFWESAAQLVGILPAIKK